MARPTFAEFWAEYEAIGITTTEELREELATAKLRRELADLRSQLGGEDERYAGQTTQHQNRRSGMVDAIAAKEQEITDARGGE